MQGYSSHEAVTQISEAQIVCRYLIILGFLRLCCRFEENVEFDALLEDSTSYVLYLIYCITSYLPQLHYLFSWAVMYKLYALFPV